MIASIFLIIIPIILFIVISFLAYADENDIGFALGVSLIFTCIYYLISLIIAVIIISLSDSNDDKQPQYSKLELEVITELCKPDVRCKLDSYKQLINKTKTRSPEVLKDIYFFDDMYEDFVKLDISAKIKKERTLGDYFLYKTKLIPYENGYFQNVFDDTIIDTKDIKIHTPKHIVQNDDSTILVVSDEYNNKNQLCKTPYPISKFGVLKNKDATDFLEYIDNCNKE